MGMDEDDDDMLVDMEVVDPYTKPLLDMEEDYKKDMMNQEDEDIFYDAEEGEDRFYDAKQQEEHEDDDSSIVHAEFAVEDIELNDFHPPNIRKTSIQDYFWWKNKDDDDASDDASDVPQWSNYQTNKKEKNYQEDYG